MDRMFSKLEEFVGTSISTPVEMTFFGSLLCYVVLWDNNEMSPEEYVKTLVDRILLSVSGKA